MDDKTMRDALEIVRERLAARNVELSKAVIIGFEGISILPSFAELETKILSMELESYAAEYEYEHPEGNNFKPRSSRQEVTHGKTNSWPTPKRRGRK